MSQINVPTRNDVSPTNQALFDILHKRLSFVPNLYATLAHSENALGNYIALQNAKSSITGKARETVNLVVSQVNDCEYCLAAHTVASKMSGLTDAQILEVRGGTAHFDPKLDALARLVKAVATQRGKVDSLLVEAFFDAGWTKENLVDTMVTIGDKIITNYLHAVTRVAVDFPAAPHLAA
jgi:alkylhydroperoxidase AhpD family core domain